MLCGYVVQNYVKMFVGGKKRGVKINVILKGESHAQTMLSVWVGQVSKINYVKGDLEQGLESFTPIWYCLTALSYFH